LQKVKDKALFEAGLRTENTMVPVIQRLAESHHYAIYVDIGAYYGDTLIPVAQLFDYCLAAEPHPELFKRLQDNFKQHDIRNTTAVRCATGSEISEQVLYSAEKEDNSSLTPLDNPRQREKIKALTLDNILAKLGSYFTFFDPAKGGEITVSTRIISKMSKTKSTSLPLNRLTNDI
jgi:FkbM family methyltransferase